MSCVFASSGRAYVGLQKRVQASGLRSNPCVLQTQYKRKNCFYVNTPKRFQLRQRPLSGNVYCALVAEVDNPETLAIYTKNNGKVTPQILDLESKKLSNEEFSQYLQQCVTPGDLSSLIAPKGQGLRQNFTLETTVSAFRVARECILRTLMARQQGKGAGSWYPALAMCRDAYKNLLKALDKQNVETMSTKDAADVVISLALAWEFLPRKQEMGKFWQRFRRVAKVASYKPNQLDADTAVDLLWSMGKPGYSRYQQKQKVTEALAKIPVEQFSADQLVQILYSLSYAKLFSSEATGLGQSVIKQLAPIVPNLKGLELAKVLTGVRKLRLYNREFMDTVENTLLQDMEQLDLQNSVVCQISMAFADLGVNRKDEVMKALTKQFLKKFDKKSQHVANMLFSLGVLNANILYAEKIIECFTLSMKQMISADFFKPAELSMIRRAQLQYRIMQRQHLELPSQLQPAAIEAAKRQSKMNQPQFDILDEVATAVGEIFPNVEKFGPVLDGEYTSKIKFFDGRHYGIVDFGVSSNYIHGDEHKRIVGSLDQKFKMLEEIGYRTVLIDNMEYKTDSNYKESFKQQLIGLRSQVPGDLPQPPAQEYFFPELLPRASVDEEEAAEFVFGDIGSGAPKKPTTETLDAAPPATITEVSDADAQYFSNETPAVDMPTESQSIVSDQQNVQPIAYDANPGDPSPSPMYEEQIQEEQLLETASTTIPTESNVDGNVTHTAPASLADENVAVEHVMQVDIEPPSDEGSYQEATADDLEEQQIQSTPKESATTGQQPQQSQKKWFGLF
eukprot:TRINITY_DN3231_c0_g3_i1.p1 TRINITY_DN3231_c0_g3~~TRINITY_DN3231_c0_g3_i1.p1  ORF type:complete len:812 (-),score=97.89 TRINITY_DN3231_c0_g3_i1:315-2687(-)